MWKLLFHLIPPILKMIFFIQLFSTLSSFWHRGLETNQRHSVSLWERLRLSNELHKNTSLQINREKQPVQSAESLLACLFTVPMFLSWCGFWVDNSDVMWLCLVGRRGSSMWVLPVAGRAQRQVSGGVGGQQVLPLVAPCTVGTKCVCQEAGGSNWMVLNI